MFSKNNITISYFPKTLFDFPKTKSQIKFYEILNFLNRGGYGFLGFLGI